jgi:L-ornithine N5-oxygenase
LWWPLRKGVNEQTHDIADSLISVFAHRSHDILTDLQTRRATTEQRNAPWHTSG